MKESRSPDEVCCSYATRSIKLTCRMLDDETIFLEGSPETLEFLGELLFAQAHFQRDCGFQFGPRRAGNALFSTESTHGIYIHRLPCKKADHKTHRR